MTSLHVYDKAKYHDDAVHELGLPAEHAANHLVFLLRWAIERGLTSEEFRSGGGRALARFASGKGSIHEVFEWWDRCFSSMMLSHEGDAFARSYFDGESGTFDVYIDDYAATLQRGLPTTYHIAYDEPSYRLLRDVIDARFLEWKRASGIPAGPLVDLTADVATHVRVESIDLLRGIAMPVMTLESVRVALGVSGIGPANPATMAVSAYVTRWITHFCAPVFFLLIGTGAFLALQRQSRGELSRFLLTRGLGLIVLELVIARVALPLNADHRPAALGTLWALGGAMIALSALVHLPVGAVMAVGVTTIAAHNLLDGVRVVAERDIVVAAFAVIPWLGVTALGFGLGQVYLWSAERRRAALLHIGLGFIEAFVILRGIDAYGDPRHWSVQASGVVTVLSFLDTTAQPPSLVYLMMTLGPALLLLLAFDGGTPRALRPALVLGRVPLFYLLTHLVLILLLVATLGEPAVYLTWIAVLLLLYPLCRWYAALKQRRRDPWLRYF